MNAQDNENHALSDFLPNFRCPKYDLCKIKNVHFNGT